MTRKDNVKTISGLKDSQFEWDRLAERRNC